MATDDIDRQADWIEKLRTLRNQLAHIPYAGRHQESIARPLAEEIEAASKAGQLPPGIKELWAEHRLAINQALTRATQTADQWDADFPVLKTRPE